MIYGYFQKPVVPELCTVHLPLIGLWAHPYQLIKYRCHVLPCVVMSCCHVYFVLTVSCRSNHLHLQCRLVWSHKLPNLALGNFCVCVLGARCIERPFDMDLSAKRAKARPVEAAITRSKGSPDIFEVLTSIVSVFFSGCATALQTQQRKDSNDWRQQQQDKQPA